MCKPLTGELEKRHHNIPPPNGEHRVANGDGVAEVPWRSMVDWGVRLLLFVIAFFLYGQRASLEHLEEKIDRQGEQITEVRIELAAAIQEDSEQAADIEVNLQTSIALMTLLNEVTANVATLTERINQTTLRLDRSGVE